MKPDDEIKLVCRKIIRGYLDNAILAPEVTASLEQEDVSPVGDFSGFAGDFVAAIDQRTLGGRYYFRGRYILCSVPEGGNFHRIVGGDIRCGPLPGGRGGTRHAAIAEYAVGAVGKFNGQGAVAFLRNACVHDQKPGAVGKPAVAGMGCQLKRPSGYPVALKNGLDPANVRGPDTLKIAEAPVAMAEHPEHWKHSFNGGVQGLGNSFMPCRHGILEGDDIQQEFQQQSWIT